MLCANIQNALREKLRMLPRGKPAGEGRTELKGSFRERAREAKGRTRRAAADIVGIRSKMEEREARELKWEGGEREKKGK